MAINRRTKSVPELPIEVRTSDVHGRGAFATCNLRRGSYEGRRFTEEEATALHSDWDPSLTYLFSLSDGTLIDGAQDGNATRHINHSCRPNCEAYEVRLGDGSLDLRVRTLAPIKAGQEMFIDYALIVDDQPPSAFRCFCRAPTCRGTMVAAF